MNSFIPPGWTAAEVEQELMGPPSRAYAPFAPLEIIDRADWAQLTCALFPTGGFNGVTRAVLHPDEADARIGEVIEHDAGREFRFRWMVMPDSLPLDLGNHLKAHGLTELPAGVASGVVFERSMYLMGGVVLPRYRRRGVYRELVAARARVARSLGPPLLTTHAMRDTSAPLLAALGFDTWLRFSTYLG